jgi:DNA-binding NarL/FixJ family response regulator
VFAAVRAGARGYVLKDSEPEDLILAVRAAARGEAIFGRAIASRMLSWFASHGNAGNSADSARRAEPFANLTAGERNVLRLMAQGHNNLAIADRLSLSQKTVRNYVSEVFRKLQVADRSQAIVRARQAGLHRDATGERD